MVALEVETKTIMKLISRLEGSDFNIIVTFDLT